jgi:hypothetical protein
LRRHYLTAGVGISNTAILKLDGNIYSEQRNEKFFGFAHNYLEASSFIWLDAKKEKKISF